MGIVEDNANLRLSWVTLLENEDGISVEGDWESCEECFADEGHRRVQVMLMDINLPGIDGIKGVYRLKAENKYVNVIMISVKEDDQAIFNSLRAGAVGYLNKLVRPEELIKAIKDTVSGNSPMSPNIARKVIAHFSPEKREEENIPLLDENEMFILQELSQGKSYKAIADEIFLSVHGVRYHLRKIYEKLQVHTRAEAVAKGLKRGIISP